MEPEGSLPCSQEPPNTGPSVTLVTSCFFYGEGLLAPRPTPMVEEEISRNIKYRQRGYGYLMKYTEYLDHRQWNGDRCFISVAENVCKY
jgi:hypothetical protein